MDTPIPPTTPIASVTLSVYEWYCLLDEMTDHLAICNRDQRRNIALIEAISTQLRGHQVRVMHEQHPNPQYRPRSDEPPPAPPAVTRGVATPWWRIWST